MTLYAAGMRLAEAAALRIPDIDSRRMQLNVTSGKGNKQRLVPLSPRLLEALRQYWQEYRPKRCGRRIGDIFTSAWSGLVNKANCGWKGSSPACLGSPPFAARATRRGGQFSDTLILASPPDLIANGLVPRRRGRILVDCGRRRLFGHTALVARRSTRWGDPIQATSIHPTRFTKTRHHGGWSNRRRDAYLHQCIRLLDAADVPWSEGSDDFEPSSWEASGDSECRCPDCGGPLQLVAEAHRPSRAGHPLLSTRDYRGVFPRKVATPVSRRIEFA